IDVSMLDSVIVTMGWVVSNYLIAGVAPRPMGNENFTAVPSGTFRTGDGLLNIAANKQEQFEVLMDAIGRPDLRDDPRFAKREQRKENRAALTTEIERAFQEKSAAEWEEILSGIGVPSGRILSVPDALVHPQIVERDLLRQFDQVAGLDRPIKLTRAGFKMAGGSPDIDSPPPELGQDTDVVLADLGYTPAEIARMHQEQVI
ncbi:MAG TPA: CoA transferase, partial [Castellaniella sp.]|nr:CoA transferase [Castellaniella sp.]